MGGSRRRLKKGKAKVRVGVVRKNKTLKAALPKDVADPTRRRQTAAALAALAAEGKGAVAAAPAAAALPSSSNPSNPPPTEALWREQIPLAQNYAAVGVVADVNEAFGRNRRNRARPLGAAEDAPALKPLEARLSAGERTHEDDDELRAAMRLPRHSGKVAPQRLTAAAEAVVEALLAAHGRSDDFSAWVKDTKRNRMQHSAGKLRAMLEAYDYYKESGEDKARHRFQPPKKPYKRL
jgi:nucleolar protein 16